MTNRKSLESGRGRTNARRHYCSVLQIRPPSHISPPCIFSTKPCRGIFIPRIGPHHAWLLPKFTIFPEMSTPRRNSYTVRFKVSVVERTKPASTGPLNISRSIASVFPSGVKSTVCWKDKSVEHLESIAAFAVENPSRSSLIIETMRYSIMWAGHRKGGRNCERKCRIPRISPPCALY